MIAPGSFSLPLRRRSLVESMLIAVTISALVVRAVETPSTTLGLVRIVFSVAAIAFVCFGSSTTIARRALAVFVFEALVGTLAFAFVDLPFVFDHQRQIGTVVLSIANDVDRIERKVLDR